MKGRSDGGVGLNGDGKVVRRGGILDLFWRWSLELKVELREFDDGWDEGWERKRNVKDDSKDFGLNNWVKGEVIY